MLSPVFFFWKNYKDDSGESALGSSLDWLSRRVRKCAHAPPKIEILSRCKNCNVGLFLELNVLCACVRCPCWWDLMPWELVWNICKSYSLLKSFGNEPEVLVNWYMHEMELKKSLFLYHKSGFPEKACYRWIMYWESLYVIAITETKQCAHWPRRNKMVQKNG